MTHGSTEDMGWVGQIGISVHVPAGSYDDVIRPLDWSPVEPRIVGQKLRTRRVGMVAEKALSGGLGRFAPGPRLEALAAPELCLGRLLEGE